MTYLDILAYAKTAEKFDKYKPIISLEKHVFDKYYDYWIESNVLYIVDVFPNNSIAGGGKYALHIVNPSKICNVSVPVILGLDLTKAPSKYAAGSPSIYNTILSNCASGSKNDNVPYTKMEINFHDVWVGNCEIKVSGSFIIADTNVNDVSGLLAPSVNTMPKMQIAAAIDDIEDIAIPLRDVLRVYPGANSDIKDLIAMHKKNIGYVGDGVNFTDGYIWRTKTFFNKSDIAMVKMNPEGTKWDQYISLKDSNGVYPPDDTNEEAWKKIASRG